MSPAEASTAVTIRAVTPDGDASSDSDVDVAYDDDDDGVFEEEASFGIQELTLTVSTRRSGSSITAVSSVTNRRADSGSDEDEEQAIEAIAKALRRRPRPPR